jgi:hypothetical protein
LKRAVVRALQEYSGEVQDDTYYLLRALHYKLESGIVHPCDPAVADGNIAVQLTAELEAVEDKMTELGWSPGQLLLLNEWLDLQLRIRSLRGER